MRIRPLAILLLLVVTMPTADVRGGAAEYPYDLALEVRWGDPPGPRAVLEDVAAELLIALRGRACYRSVTALAEQAADAPAAGFVLRVTLQGFTEEVQYDATIAERATSYEPGIERKLLAEFRVTARQELVHAASDLVVRSATSFVVQRARPVVPGQDDVFAREEARRLGVNELAFETARRACRGSAKKLERQLEQARQAGRAEASPR